MKVFVYCYHYLNSVYQSFVQFCCNSKGQGHLSVVVSELYMSVSYLNILRYPVIFATATFHSIVFLKYYIALATKGLMFVLLSFIVLF